MLPLLLVALAPLAAAPADAPAQAARGRALFFDATDKVSCSTCHEIEGKGTAVGPKLTDLARLSPKAVVVAILSSRTVHAKEVELKEGGKFPAMVPVETKEQVVAFDLSKNPPEKLTLEPAAVKSIKDNSMWKHPPASTGFTTEQLADVIAYIRWVGFGDTKGVAAADLK